MIWLSDDFKDTSSFFLVGTVLDNYLQTSGILKKGKGLGKHAHSSNKHTSLLSTPLWPELSEMTPPSFKGVWEVLMFPP